MALTWQFDVITARLVDMKGGGTYPTVRSRITLSAAEFPRWRTAAEVAACMAMSIHGGMAINIYPRLGDTP